MDNESLQESKIPKTISLDPGLLIPFIRDEEVKNRYILAEKVLTGKSLTIEEKRQIYKSLTGSLPPTTKKGKPSQQQRDMLLAIDYLTEKEKGNEKALKIKKRLAKKYNLPGWDVVSDDTFYKALNRGIKRLESYSQRWIAEIESGLHDDMETEFTAKMLARMKDSLLLVTRYRENKESTRK